MEMLGTYPCCIYGDWNRSNSKTSFLLLSLSLKIPSNLQVKENGRPEFRSLLLR